jgi:hypothetical protein
MFTLASVPLIGDNKKRHIETFLNKFQPLSNYIPWRRRSFPGRGMVATTWQTGFYAEPYLRLNTFRFPTGAQRWGYGHFLCNSDAVGYLLGVAQPKGQPWQKIPLAMGNPESNQGGTLVAGETMSVNVYLMPPTPLSGIRGLSGQLQSLYLLTVVDQRYFWWWQNFGNTTITSSTTWANLVQVVQSALNLSTITVDTISPAYLQPSVEMFSLPYEPIPIIFDAIAKNIGMRVVMNYDETVSMQLYQTALTALNQDMAAHQNRVILSGGQRFASTL